MKKVETWLPLFSGFYGTIWDFDSEISNFCYNENVKYDDLQIDYDIWEEAIVQDVCNQIESVLKRMGFVKYIKYQSISHPREYNFHNDSVNVEIGANVRAIRKYLVANQDEFDTYLHEVYTSRSGFISHYPNNYQDWYADTKGFLDFDPHRLGAVLNFILISHPEGIDEYELYDRCEHCYADEYVTILRKETEDMDDYDKEIVARKCLEHIDFSFGYMRVLKQTCEENALIHGESWQDVIVDKYAKEIINEAGVKKVDISDEYDPEPIF